MKVGDKLYCYSKGSTKKIIRSNHSISIGKYYNIIQFDYGTNNDFDICIRGDNNRGSWFSTKDNEYNYKIFFRTEKELRKLKLNKINESKESK